MFSDSLISALLAFIAIFALIFIAGEIWGRHDRSDQKRASSRLRGLMSADGSASPLPAPGLLHWILSAIPKLGSWKASKQREIGGKLSVQLLRAGYFSSKTPQLFRGIKVLLIILMGAAGAGLGSWMGAGSLKGICLWATAGLLAGGIAPGLWLSQQVKKRQQLLLQGLPDVLDMLVLCLEAGVSVNAAIQRVTDEIQLLHPILGMEMNIVQREMQLGLSVGDALKKFADRCGLSDVRDLAVVIQQSERYGVAISKALRNFAETSRVQRQLRAEELAQQAAVKILFPTLLCIFPAIFVVILGPAAFQTAKLFVR